MASIPEDLCSWSAFSRLCSTVSILSWPLDTMGGMENQSRVTWSWLYFTILWLSAFSQHVWEEYYTATHKTLDKSLNLSMSQLSRVKTILHSLGWGWVNTYSQCSVPVSCYYCNMHTYIITHTYCSFSSNKNLPSWVLLSPTQRFLQRGNEIQKKWVICPFWASVPPTPFIRRIHSPEITILGGGVFRRELILHGQA